METRRIVLICMVLFTVSAGVRLLVWQNNKVAIDGVQYVVTEGYEADARTLAGGDLRTFLTGPNPPSDAEILTHPPGYPIIIAAVYQVFGETEAFRIIQILLNSLAPILIFLIVLRLFDQSTAIIAGTLVCFGPQFAYYSGIKLPDGLCVIPILAGLYAMVCAVNKPRMVLAILCGVSIGIACWLRANAMLMPIFFALFALFLLPRVSRVRFALTLVAAFIVTIAPITIRNYVVFHAFVPLSLGMGHMIVLGVAQYDSDGQFGLPKTDEGEMEMDAIRDAKPGQYGRLYDPDGVRRERERARIGLGIIKDNPAWYFTVGVRRAVMMLRMERVPVIDPKADECETTAPALYYLNKPLKFVQKAFITAVILPLCLFGAVILLRDRQQQRSFILLSIVPLYYMSVQSLIYTEYRFFMAVPVVMMIFSAVSLGFLADRLFKNRRRLDFQNLAGSE